MAQVIPFKRESWEMNVNKLGESKEREELQQRLKIKFFDSYKTQFRTKKEYK